MKVFFLYEQSIFIKQKNEQNLKKMSKIICASLEKYKNFLGMREERKNGTNKKKINLKNISSKNICDNYPNFFIVENINKIKIKYELTFL